MSGSMRLYFSALISYILSAMSFSLRKSKSSLLTSPHRANLSSSVVSAEISSISCFLRSDFATTSAHNEITFSSESFGSEPFFCLGSLISPRIASVSIALFEYSLKAVSFSLAPSIFSRCTRPIFLKAFNASSFSLLRRTTETFFIGSIICQPPVLHQFLPAAFS